MAEHLGEIRCDDSIEAKLRHKTPSLTSDDVRAALQWPARAFTAWDTDETHGERLVAMGDVDGRRLIAWLVRAPEWDPDATTWMVKTARWVDNA